MGEFDNEENCIKDDIVYYVCRMNEIVEVYIMSLTPQKKSKKVKYPKRKTHFTEDGTTRYCTGRPKGKDELSRNWIEVDCQRCHNERDIKIWWADLCFVIFSSLD